eukprot:501791-Amphidinium_carterae.1
MLEQREAKEIALLLDSARFVQLLRNRAKSLPDCMWTSLSCPLARDLEDPGGNATLGQWGRSLTLVKNLTWMAFSQNDAEEPLDIRVQKLGLYPQLCSTQLSRFSRSLAVRQR